jgi:hypothetical protein
VNPNETWWQFKDTLRSVLYSLTPFVLLATIWGIGYARQMESRVASRSTASNEIGTENPQPDADDFDANDFRAFNIVPQPTHDQISDLHAGND